MGAVLSGEVVDDRTMQVIVKLSSDDPVGPLLFVVGASNGGVECHTGVSGEATLEVVTGS